MLTSRSAWVALMLEARGKPVVKTGGVLSTVLNAAVTASAQEVAIRIPSTFISMLASYCLNAIEPGEKSATVAVKAGIVAVAGSSVGITPSNTKRLTSSLLSPSIILYFAITR
jgi:predicted metal-dependent phosphotriesterase family hydrolase